MQFSKIGVISNPDSTRLKHEMPAFRDVMARFPDILHRELGTIDDMLPILKSYAEQSVDLIIVNGGDGSLQWAVTKLLNDNPYHVLPQLTVLPGGRTNMTAAAIGVSGTPCDLMSAIGQHTLARTLDGLAVQMPFVGMRLTPQHDKIYGAFFGTAAIVRGIHTCRKKFHPLNLPNWLTHMLTLGYLLCSSINPFKTANSPMRREDIAMQFDSENHTDRPYFIVLVTTLNKLVLGLAANTSVGEGVLRFLSVDYGGLNLFRALRTLIFGESKSKIVKGFVRRKMSRLKINCTCPVTLDGEMFDPVPGQPIELTASDPLKFVCFST
jgi:diacylglycerol kinase family enzyme